MGHSILRPATTFGATAVPAPSRQPMAITAAGPRCPVGSRTESFRVDFWRRGRRRLRAAVVREVVGCETHLARERAGNGQLERWIPGLPSITVNAVLR